MWHAIVLWDTAVNQTNAILGPERSSYRFKLIAWIDLQIESWTILKRLTDLRFLGLRWIGNVVLSRSIVLFVAMLGDSWSITV